MTVTLTVNGQVYQRWTGVRVRRGLKQVCAGFAIETPGEVDPPILPFHSCVLADNGMPLVTGYVDEVHIEIAAHGTGTRVTGRSKTADLVDCMLPNTFTSNQFIGYKLDAVARTVAKPFGVNVVVGQGVDLGDPIVDATYEWNETIFHFLERLARMRGVLLTDDPQGNLVIATLGTARAPADLATGPGGNVFQARGLLSGRQRFSQYTVRSQAGIIQTGAEVSPDVMGVAADPGVPRPRYWAGIAESPSLPADAKKRAEWEASHRLGLGVVAVLSVPEWTVGDALWQTNQLTKCTVPRLGLNDTLLIGAVDFREDQSGRRADLAVAKPGAYSPEPLTAIDQTWAGIMPVVQGAAGAPTSATLPAGVPNSGIAGSP